MKNVQTMGQNIGEVLKQLDEDRFLIKATSGPRYVVGCRTGVDKENLKPGDRVALDMATMIIMRKLPREVDPRVFNMLTEDPGEVSYTNIGGLSEQIRELREVIELPLTNPELFVRVGIKAPKGVLLYGPPGTGKTLLARAAANQMEANFLKVVSAAIVDKYIGESARIIREMFGYARDHEPCVIFMDEIDAIGGKRLGNGQSADREIQRTLMELLNQLDGFEELGRVKVIMEIHSAKLAKKEEIDFEPIVKMSDEFNGADLRNVCTEAGMFAINSTRDYVIQEDFMRAVRKVGEAKKLETKLDYEKP